MDPAPLPLRRARRRGPPPPDARWTSSARRLEATLAGALIASQAGTLARLGASMNRVPREGNGAEREEYPIELLETEDEVFVGGLVVALPLGLGSWSPLGRAVHCNLGCPALWWMLPGD